MISGVSGLLRRTYGFALGSYGLDLIQYAKLLSACWAELTGIHDECAAYYKGADWRLQFRPY